MSRVVDPDGAGPDGWGAWETALVDAVLRLHDGESLTVTAGPGHRRMARPAGTGLRILVPQRKQPVSPSVRLVRVEEHLRGHWAGAERLGGPFPWSPDEVDAIVGLGWHRPSVGDGPDFVRFWPDDVPQGPYLPYDDARRAAEVVTRTFRTVLPDHDDGLPTVDHRPAD